LQGNTVSLQTAKLIVNSIEEDIKRLKNLNLVLVKLEQEKSVGEICQELSQIALVKAAEKINKKMNYKYLYIIFILYVFYLCSLYCICIY